MTAYESLQIPIKFFWFRGLFNKLNESKILWQSEKNTKKLCREHCNIPFSYIITLFATLKNLKSDFLRSWLNSLFRMGKVPKADVVVWNIMSNKCLFWSNLKLQISNHLKLVKAVLLQIFAFVFQLLIWEERTVSLIKFIGF